jgi:hypothetical protein
VLFLRKIFVVGFDKTIKVLNLTLYHEHAIKGELNMKKEITAAILAISVALGGGVSPSAMSAASINKSDPLNRIDQLNVLNDISKHWAKSAIEDAVAKGYVKGYPDGTFKPNEQVTRAEFLAIITRASKLKDHGAQENFDDVSATYWAVEAINKGIGMGFINPTDYGKTFEPQRAVTRGEMARWLVNGLVKSDSSFSQALKDTENTLLPFAETFKGGFNKSDIPYVAVARGTGLLGGFPDGNFYSERTATRAEVVVLLSRYLKVEGTNADGYKALSELREVGLTGTNMVTIGGTVHNDQYPFEGILGEPIASDNYSGTLKIFHYIVVDSFKKSPESVYAPVFLDKSQDHPQVGWYEIFIDISFTPSRNITKNTYENSVNNASGGTIRGKQVAMYGYKTIPWKFMKGEEYERPEDLFIKGIERKFWVTNLLERDQPAGWTTTTRKTTVFVLR